MILKHSTVGMCSDSTLAPAAGVDVVVLKEQLKQRGGVADAAVAVKMKKTEIE